MAPLDAKSLFAALVAAEVRFIVIGGFAVSAHGYLRGTKDLDIVPDPFEYRDLDAAAIEDEVLGHRVRFCGYEDLVEMKRAAGRLEDELDLKRLRALRGE